MAIHFGSEPRDENEKTALELLKKNLNDEWRIFNNLIYGNTEIDLVLFHPNYGIITFEIKGKLTEQLSDKVLKSVFSDSHYKSKKLIEYINKTHNAKLPTNSVGNVSIPVVAGTLYPRASRSEFQKMKNDSIKTDDYDDKTIIFGDDLTTPDLENRLFSFFEKVSFAIAPLSPEHIKIVEEILNKSVIHYKLTLKNARHLETIKYFDSNFIEEKLNEVLSKLQNGVVFIEGVAGSGKTMLLALTAIELSIRYPDLNILLTYNTFSLRSVIKKYIKDLFTLKPDLKSKFDSRPKKNLYLQQIGSASNQSDIKFDIILVDEAQDLGSSPLYVGLINYDSRLLKILNRTNFNSKIIFAYDPSQIFSKDLNTILHKFDPEKNALVKWDPEFMRSQKIHLTKSYRNTYEILLFANAILKELNLDPILDIELAPKSGIIPKIVHLPLDSIANFIITEIENIRTSYNLKDYKQFAVLLTDNQNLPKMLKILPSFESAGVPFNYFTGNTNYDELLDGAVTISDGARAKGSGWDVVFFVIDEYEKLNKYIYTCITRAETMLYIIYYLESDTIKKLKEILNTLFP